MSVVCHYYSILLWYLQIDFMFYKIGEDMKKYLWISVLVIISVMFNSCKKGKSLGKISADANNYDGTHIDLDLSGMNYNMLSSVAFDIMVAPEKYANKRIKTSGNFYTSVYEDTRYFSAIVWDPTGCCPAGMDFIPPESMNFPEDFPEPDEKIIVIGTLKYVDENNDRLLFYAEKINAAE